MDSKVARMRTNTTNTVLHCWGTQNNFDITKITVIIMAHGKKNQVDVQKNQKLLPANCSHFNEDVLAMEDPDLLQSAKQH